MKKKTRIVFVGLLVTFFVIVVGTTIVHFVVPSNFEKAATCFNKDKELIVIVANYLSNYEGTNLQIDMETRFLKNYKESDTSNLNVETIPIEDVAVKNAIQQLFDQGYYDISKDENTIIFSKWRKIEFGSGFVYSIDGISEPNSQYLQFCTKLTPLTENGWYYYEEDYNKWRAGQRP